MVQLTSVLGLPDNCEDDEIALALVAQFTAAVNDVNPAFNLNELARIVSTYEGSRYLDPLNILPILLPYAETGAIEIISVIGESSSAKEVIIAAQEAAEKLRLSFEVDLEEPEIDEVGNRVLKRNSRTRQLVVLTELYSKVIPRLTLRRKSALETIKPLFEELNEIVNLSGSGISSLEARELISSCSKLSQSAFYWVTSNSTDQCSSSKDIIKGFLSSVSCSLVPHIQCFIAQRTFEKFLPQFVVRSTIKDGWQEGSSSISDLLAAYHTIGVDVHDCTRPASVAHLIAFAYQPSAPDPLDRLPFLLPVLLSSLQANNFLEESLAALIHLLHAWPPDQLISPDITAPLIDTLPTVASIHPNPLVRHQAYRIISLILASSDPRLRFQQLLELTTHSEYPQMRIAAVGLLKDHFLRVFAATESAKSNDPLLSNMFLRTFGPTLFRPDPPNLFTDDLHIKSLEESSEPARLSECLSFYLVILRRDKNNLTGIRDKDMIQTVEANLLAPLRRTLNRWMQEQDSKADMNRLLSKPSLLWLALERVDDAVKDFIN